MMKKHILLALAAVISAALIGGVAAQPSATQASCAPTYQYGGPRDNDMYGGRTGSTVATVAMGSFAVIPGDSSFTMVMTGVASSYYQTPTMYYRGCATGYYRVQVIEYYCIILQLPDRPTPPVQQATGNVNVQYVDADSNAVLATTPWQGDSGTSVTATQYGEYQTTMQQLEEQGYTLDSSNLPAQGDIVFPADGKTTTYTVKLAKKQATGNVNVQYVDADSDAVLATTPWQGDSDATVSAAQYGEYQATLKQLEDQGYTLDSSDLPAQADIHFPADGKTTTYTVKLVKKQATGNVNVQYVDVDDNNKVLATTPWQGDSDTTVSAAQYGEYEATLKQLEDQGYTLDSSDLPAQGSIHFPADGETTTYTVGLTKERWTIYPATSGYMPDMIRSKTRTFAKTYVVNGSTTDAKPDVQTTSFTRDYEVSTIAAHSKYGVWTPAEAGIGEYTVPQQAGYNVYVQDANGRYVLAPASYPALTLTADSEQPTGAHLYYVQDGIDPNAVASLR